MDSPVCAFQRYSQTLMIPIHCSMKSVLKLLRPAPHHQQYLESYTSDNTPFNTSWLVSLHLSTPHHGFFIHPAMQPTVHPVNFEYISIHPQYLNRYILVLSSIDHSIHPAKIRIHPIHLAIFQYIQCIGRCIRCINIQYILQLEYSQYILLIF